MVRFGNICISHSTVGNEHALSAERKRNWLDRAIGLDLRLNFVNEHPKEILENIYRNIHLDHWKKAPERKGLFFKIMANLLLGAALDRPVRYSRNTHSYRRKHTGAGVVILLSLIDEMESQGLIKQRKGYRNTEDKIQRQTKLWASENLISLFREISCEDVVKEPPLMLVELRDRVTKEPKDYEIDERISRMIEQLYRYGDMMKYHDLRLELPHIKDDETIEIIEDILDKYTFTYFLPITTQSVVVRSIVHNNNLYNKIHKHPWTLPHNITLATRTNKFSIEIRYKWLHRVFNDSFQLGGRYYGAAWQMLHEPLRNLIWIDGEPTVELDYSGQHLRMLYHLEGLDFEGDPYSFGKEELRPLYKIASLVLINSKSDKPYHAIRKAFVDAGFESRFEGCLTKEFIESVIEDFCVAHHRIRKHFFSDVGIRLQNIDASITSRIIDHFMAQDIPVLAVQDYYIVPARRREELECVIEHHSH